jgi:hypothetical protein
MPIEGPLRELGLPDVFQLLDLSRKTGMLKVKSQLRDDEGHVYFDAGRVVQANLRSKPTPREGFFSFEERDLTDIPADTRVKIATESLLMESARRIDEWSRIADKVPHLLVVPVLAAVPDDHESQLDLLPHEWEVLSMIDGRRDLRAIATALGRNEFEAAKVVYGLVTTGVVDIPKAKKVSSTIPPLTVSAVPPPPNPEIRASFAQGKASARAGDFATARASWERFLQLAPDAPEAARVRAAIEALNALRDAVEGLDG